MNAIERQDRIRDLADASAACAETAAKLREAAAARRLEAEREEQAAGYYERLARAHFDDLRRLKGTEPKRGHAEIEAGLVR